MLILTGFSCQQNTEEMTYPVTQKIPVSETYFDTEVTDNYRWLEDVKRLVGLAYRLARLTWP